MASFDIDGIKLRVPGHCLTDALVKALESGHYEWNEKAALKRHLTIRDKVLELGAGAGYLSILAAQIVGGANVTSVEANPSMMDVLRKNLDSNGARDTDLRHGAVVADDYGSDTVSFVMRDAFWASSIAEEDAPDSKLVTVPALRLSDLLEEVRPTVVTMDVEGGEVELSQQDWPDSVRLLIMEIHTQKYPPSTVKSIFDGLSRAGFTFMPWGTRGEVVTLQRVREGVE